MIRGALAGLIATTALACAQAPLFELKVTGNQRLRAEDILTASGLRLNQAVTRDDFDAATNKLSETGLFTSVDYRYDSTTSRGVIGFALTIEVVEEPAQRAVEIDIPGFDESKLWQDLERADPLITQQMPDNERAIAYYSHAIQNLTHQEEIVIRSEADLGSGSMTGVFLPANLPKVTEVAFAGSHAIEKAELERAIASVAPGSEYTEHRFRRLLDLNIKPLYEEKGYLTVNFPHVTIDSGMVSVQVEEGQLWNLGKVGLHGDHLPVDDMQKAAQFPVGKPANWKEIMESVGRMEQVLRRQGYLEVSLEPVRAFQPDKHAVDLTIQVNKGKQFLFGVLQIRGFSEQQKQAALQLWTLKASAPLDELYVDEYIRSLLDTLKVGVKLAAKELRVRPGTQVVDVILTFQ